MKEIDSLHGHSVALILVSKNERGEEDWEMYRGQLAVEDGALYLDALDDSRVMEILPEWYRYLQATDPTILDVVEDAEFVLALPLRALPPEIEPLHDAG